MGIFLLRSKRPMGLTHISQQNLFIKNGRECKGFSKELQKGQFISELLAWFGPRYLDLCMIQMHPGYGRDPIKPNSRRRNLMLAELVLCTAWCKKSNMACAAVS